jgi:hypothetical protein
MSDNIPLEGNDEIPFDTDEDVKTRLLEKLERKRRSETKTIEGLRHLSAAQRGRERMRRASTRRMVLPHLHLTAGLSDNGERTAWLRGKVVRSRV